MGCLHLQPYVVLPRGFLFSIPSFLVCVCDYESVCYTGHVFPSRCDQVGSLCIFGKSVCGSLVVCMPGCMGTGFVCAFLRVPACVTECVTLWGLQWDAWVCSGLVLGGRELSPLAGHCVLVSVAKFKIHCTTLSDTCGVLRVNGYHLPSSWSWLLLVFCLSGFLRKLALQGWCNTSLAPGNQQVRE